MVVQHNAQHKHPIHDIFIRLTWQKEHITETDGNSHKIDKEKLRLINIFNTHKFKLNIFIR